MPADAVPAEPPAGDALDGREAAQHPDDPRPAQEVLPGPSGELLTDSPPGEWVPDILPGFERMTIPLEVDEEGPNAATLVRPVRPGPDAEVVRGTGRVPLLYVHGWSDYFYNAPLARLLEDHGFAFHALDLRKYGRSLRPGQTPGWVESLQVYDDEIGSALRTIAQDHPAPPVLMGHSTGGLTLSLWAARHPGRARALVLNSPWLEMQGSTLVRLMAQAVLDPVARVQPKTFLKLPRVDHYWRSISDAADGEWSLHPLWRPQLSFEVPGGWLQAVMAGHAQVAAGLGLAEPIYVMLSDRTVFGTRWSEDMTAADIVLDVDVLAQRAVRLGRHVTVVRHAGALHDVMASPRPIREAAAAEMLTWLDAYAGEPAGLSTAAAGDAAGTGVERSTAPPYLRSRRA
ncbi:alpha/beta hydrolase [Citricoccus sp. SGAir0253]|uniref:alpha/beta hydrolase n=1 Tax=Citricoccus sp. SGAir0253 TaxID=2567881 RepID=UPI0010CD4826|nr:alpha/beta hydrolase [Citricoccus sp. SGAir0253]QCU78016.1 alpha/beta hydrolase [Citricoccus sp. SGAir0253]